MSYTYYETMMEDYADLMEAVREDERECDRAWQATLRELMEGWRALYLAARAPTAVARGFSQMR